MKLISILVLIFLSAFNINAQDTISRKNGEIINASILGKSKTILKYKFNNNSNGDTTYSTKLSGINSIHYENGEVDLLSSQNPRSKFPLGVNYGFIVARGLNVSVTELFKMFSGSIDYLVTPKISAEVSILGLLPYPSQYLFSLGGKYWFANRYSKSGFSPFLGLFYTNLLVENYEYIEENKPQWSSLSGPQVPIGISYITKFGLQTSLQLDSYIWFDSGKYHIFQNFIEFRIGWRFKTGK